MDDHAAVANELGTLAAVFSPLYFRLKAEELASFTDASCLHDEPDSSDDDDRTIYHPQQMAAYRDWLGLWLNVFDMLFFVSPQAPLYMSSNPIIMRFIRIHARELSNPDFTGRWLSRQNRRHWAEFLSRYDVKIPSKRKPRGPVRVP